MTRSSHPVCRAADVGESPGNEDRGAEATSGPLAPGHSDEALRDQFIERHGQRFRRIIEYRDAFQAWVKLENGLWSPDYPAFAQAVSDGCSEVGDWYRANGGPGGAKIDQALKGGGKHYTVERMLSKSPALATTLRQFDSVPYELNTPDFVVNLQDGTWRSHDTSDLFRLRTAVSPDFFGGPPERWLNNLARLAGGQEWLIEVLQRWFGYMLTGYTDWQYMLFIPGPKGTGKSLLVRVLNEVMGSYAKQKNPEFWVLRKNQDERFAYDDLAGIRGLLGTETLDNATWYETRIVQIADGDELDVEFKGGAKRVIPSQAKITIAGNHEPAFPSGDREGGLTRRLMRLYIGSEHTLPSSDVDEHILRDLIAEEGPRILAWLILGAIKALGEGRHRFRTLAEPLFAAAQTYVDEGDPRAQFIADRRIIPGDPDKDYIELTTVYKDYLHYRREDDPGFAERRSAFKNAMTDRFQWRWEMVRRGEPNKRKHGLAAAYGWKYRDLMEEPPEG